MDSTPDDCHDSGGILRAIFGSAGCAGPCHQGRGTCSQDCPRAPKLKPRTKLPTLQAGVPFFERWCVRLGLGPVYYTVALAWWRWALRNMGPHHHDVGEAIRRISELERAQ